MFILCSMQKLGIMCCYAKCLKIIQCIFNDYFEWGFLCSQKKTFKTACIALYAVMLFFYVWFLKLLPLTSLNLYLKKTGLSKKTNDSLKDRTSQDKHIWSWFCIFIYFSKVNSEQGIDLKIHYLVIDAPKSIVISWQLTGSQIDHFFQIITSFWDP